MSYIRISEEHSPSRNLKSDHCLKCNMLFNITAFWDVVQCSSVEGHNVSKQTREYNLKVEESCLPWRWRQKISQNNELYDIISQKKLACIFTATTTTDITCHLPWGRRTGLLSTIWVTWKVLIGGKMWKSHSFDLYQLVKKNNSCFCIILTTDRGNK
jgi:hypothetical protein